MKAILILLAFIQVLFLGVSSAQDAKKDKLLSLKDSTTGVVTLNSNSYDRFTEGKRNYGLVVLLTALDAQLNCAPCRQFDPEFDLVSKTFQKTKEANNLIFGRLDFRDGQAVYQRLKLMSAPNVYYFPPQAAGENKDFIKYDFPNNGFTAEPFAGFLSNESGYKVAVGRPINYLKLATKVFLAIAAAAVLKFMYRHFSAIIFHKTTWTILSIIFILTFTSGFMWNRIRNPPFLSPGQNGQINYIASGFSSQLGVEVQIVASVYAVLAFSILALIKTVPKFPDQTHQRFGVYLWVGCVVFIFSCLLAIFHVKNGGYPFRLLL